MFPSGASMAMIPSGSRSRTSKKPNPYKLYEAFRLEFEGTKQFGDFSKLRRKNKAGNKASPCYAVLSTQLISIFTKVCSGKTEEFEATFDQAYKDFKACCDREEAIDPSIIFALKSTLKVTMTNYINF